MKPRYALFLVCGLLLGWSAPAAADLADTVAKIKPAVVLVGTFKATQNPRFQFRGTGFLVGDGQQVVTSAHVLPPEQGGADAPELVVQLRQGQDGWQMRAARLQGQDGARDLALLRIEGPGGPVLALGDSRRVREGDDLAFMGFPIGGVLGFSSVTHRATVSSITAAALPSPSAQRLTEQAIRGLRGASFEIFQLDATAFPGNSGGPLFDPASGVLLGVVSMTLVKGRRESALSHPSGIVYAVPGRYVKDLLERHR